jgi:hypothetical protein
MSVKPNLPSGKGASYKGEVKGTSSGQKFAKPFEEIDSGVMGMDGLHDDIGEKSGFQANTDAYIVKKGMAYGEAAKLNILPPGMDINDQPYADIRDMELQTVVEISYPGDGWSPTPRDISEDYSPKGNLA